VRTLLHLVRDGARPDVMADRDWVVYLGDGSLQLAARGDPPLPPRPIDHDQHVARAVAADHVVTR
jgi:hypothetical protein